MKVQLTPDFTGLDDPGAIKKSIEDMKSTDRQTVGKSEALDLLLDQVEPLDFQALKYPEVKRLRKQLDDVEPGSDQADKILKQINSFKMKRDDFVFDTVKSTLELAEKNNWGLCLNSNSVYLYNGAYWDLLDRAQFETFICDIAEGMVIPERTARDHTFQ